MKKQNDSVKKDSKKGVKKPVKTEKDLKVVKKGVHPKLVEATASCVCGESFQAISTKEKLAVGICYMCHPFYTGKQKFVDTAGRIERFMSKFGNKADYNKAVNSKK